MASSTRPKKLVEYQSKRDFTKTPEPSGRERRRPGAADDGGHRFVLVRRDKPNGKDDWLLLHKRDDAAEPGWDPEEHPQSVKTGRTNDEVAAGRKRPRKRASHDRKQKEPADL